MTLMELFQSDTFAQSVLTRIMLQRIRMRYKRDEIRQALRHTANVGHISMTEVYELHWFLHPDDPRRVPKANMTRPRAQRPKKD